MKEKISVVVGRFEPIHKGHEKLIDVAFDKSDVVLILVIDNEKCVMPVDFRIKLISEIYNKEVLEGRIIIKKFVPVNELNHNYGESIISSVKLIFSKVPDYIVFGSDKVVERCFDEKYIDDISFIKVERKDFNVSGTNLRKAIKENDKYYIRHGLNKKLFKYINKILQSY